MDQGMALGCHGKLVALDMEQGLAVRSVCHGCHQTAGPVEIVGGNVFSSVG